MSLHCQRPISKTIDETAHAPIVPFQLNASNVISFPSLINQQDSLHLMFHTAVSMLSLTVEGSKMASSVNFTDTARITSWGGTSTSRFGQVKNLQIGTRTWTELSISEDRHSGRGTQGKFGWNLFTNEIFLINFDAHHLYFPGKITASFLNWDKHQIKVDGPMLFIELKINLGVDTLIVPFLIHSGFSGTLLLADELIQNHQILDVLPVTEGRDLKDSMGNIIKTQKVLIPSLIVGRHTLTDIPIGAFSGKLGGQKISVMGADLLKRFNLLFDLTHDLIYLSPSRHWSADFFE